MTYVPVVRRKKVNRVPINIHQTQFSKGYISTLDNSRRPHDSLSDLTNMEIVQDSIARPRPPLVRYGTQPTNTIIGRGECRYNGVRYLLFMMNVSGVGKIFIQSDGGAFTQIGGLNSYDPSAWAGFAQSTNRVYVFNGVNNTTYIDLTTMNTVEYTALATPSAPTATATANLLSGTTRFNYYYKVTANNTVGESTASAASTAVAVNDIRDNWSATGTKTVTVTWSAVTGAYSYTIYGGDDPNNLNEITTIANLTTLSFTDDGSLTLNPFKLAPASNSTQGFVATWMYVDTKNATIYGVTTDNKVYYSAAGTGNNPADFSSLNGGGFVTIDLGGASQVNYVTGFRTGKGDPVITISARGAAGKGHLYHMTFNTATYGNQVITYPDVIEANGQAGTYAPRATVKANDAIYYPTGTDFQSTGTSQNIVNILTTNSIAQDIMPDVAKISLLNLSKAAGVEYLGKIFFCLPVGTTENSEIWYMDTYRKNIWVLRWTVPAKDIWLYEDSQGAAHLCVLVNNVILEFTRSGSQPTTDDGVPFQTRCAFSSLVWDADGITMANIFKMYFKLLTPQGSIAANTYGLSQWGQTSNVGSNSYAIDVSFTGIGQWDYSGNYQYGDDPGQINTYAKSVAVLEVDPKGLLNQLDWEVVTNSAGCDYLLSSVNTRGNGNSDLIYKGSG